MDEMRYLLALLLAASCGLCFADERADKMAAANQLVELLQIGKLVARQAADCVPKAEDRAARAKSAYEKDPKPFGGITPQSQHWQEVEHLYERFYVETCLYLQPDIAKNAYASALAEGVSLPALEAAIRFYSSPDGQLYASESTKAMAEYCSDVQLQVQAMRTLAQTNYRNGLRKLTERYKADPQ
jgi:hypothetical protein